MQDKKFFNQTRANEMGITKIDVRSMNQYTQVLRRDTLKELAEMSKKDRGVGRLLSRFLDTVRKPSIKGHDCIHFEICLDYFNPGGQQEPDWYSVLLESNQGLRDPITFQYCVFDLVYSYFKTDIIDFINYQGLMESSPSLAEFKSLILLRFIEVWDPIRTISASPSLWRKRLPVISVLIPNDIETWSAQRKINYARLLSKLTLWFSGEYLSRELKRVCQDVVQQLNKEAQEVWPLFDGLVLSRRLYLDMSVMKYKDIDNEVECSSLNANPDYTFLTP